MRLPRTLAVALISFIAGAAVAQRQMPAVKLAIPPTIDGRVEASEWQDATRIEGGFDEETGSPIPSEFAQEFRLAYDEKYIYIAARLSDPDPRRIAATETRTNVSVDSDDNVVFAIDPFGTLQGLNEFSINPNGATELDIAGGRAPKREWLGEILAAGRITERGWECEARIPWSIMQLPSPGVRTLRADFGRYIQRTGRAYISSNIAGEQIQRISMWVDVDVPRSGERRALKLLPFGYAGYSNENGEIIANSGLDMKMSLSDQMEFVGTINPDFRNIENDVLSLDFSYFERLAGESRPFFLEGSDYFGTSRDASLFASQRIRSFDAGWKVYGLLGNNTRLAFLNTWDFGSESTFVANVRHQFNPRENLQVAGTLLDRPELDNSASFVSYFKGFSNYGIFAQYSATDDSIAGQGSRFNPGILYEGQGINAFIEYQQISPDFLPRLGFAPRVGFKGWSSSFDWEKAHPRGPVMETELSFNARDEDNWDGGPFFKSIGGGGSVALRNNLEFGFDASYEEFEGFKDRIFEVNLGYPRGDGYRNVQFEYAWGRVAGEDFELFELGAAYRPLKGFQIRLSHEVLRHIEHESQTILSVNYELNKFDSVSSRLIRRDDDTNVYFAWRRAGNRGVEYYVILGDPNARTFRESIIVKAVVPFEVVFGR